MKKTRRIIALFLVLMAFTLAPMKAEAQVLMPDPEIIIQPMYTNINNFISSFDIDDDGRVYIYIIVSARNCDKVRITAYVDKYIDGVWTQIGVWSRLEEDTFCSLSASQFFVSSDEQYRLRSYAYVYSGGKLVESDMMTSRIIST
ncbi:MAG TPA: hypothetical protein GXZ28_05415 [Clostridiales bacterium]|nr:hypothetical protein [Clostridiales bacterium]